MIINLALFMSMYRYFLQLTYNGTAYNGWQIQDNTPNTIQQVLTERITNLLGEHIELVGCGRTDTGVHAKKYVAHFDSNKHDLHINSSNWLYKMNKVLPEDIAIQYIIPVANNANARFDAVSRTYQYHIHTKKNPFLLNRSYYLYGALDLDLMNDAAQRLFHFSDFSAFSKSNTQVKTNKCIILHAKWHKEEDAIVFTISANRFLRNMVRAIVGTLLDVGRKKIAITDFEIIIKNKNRSNAGYSVPAGGLYLVDVVYPERIIAIK